MIKPASANILQIFTVAICVLPFALAVAYPLGSLLPMRWPVTSALFWDAGLSFLFFMQHSGMVRRRFRTWLAGFVPPNFYSAIYAIASGAALTLVVALWQTTEIRLLEFQGAWLWVARGCGGMAIVVFVYSVYALRSFDPFGLAPIRAYMRESQMQTPKFVVQGPYQWVRHPLYSCVIVLIWSCPELTADRLLLNVIWTAWICGATVLEETDLRNEFGKAYQDYCSRVPMLVPWRGRVQS